MDTTALSTATRVRHNPETRKALILEQAIELLGEKGFYGLTVEELAKRCDLSNAGILYYFGNKDGLLLAVLTAFEQAGAAKQTPVVDALEEKLETGELQKQDVIDLLLSFVDYGSRQPGLIRLFAVLQAEALNPDHPAHQWYKANEAAYLEAARRFLQPFVADAEARAKEIVAMLDGFNLQWLRSEQAFDLKKACAATLKRLLPELHE